MVAGLAKVRKQGYCDGERGEYPRRSVGRRADPGPRAARCWRRSAWRFPSTSIRPSPCRASRRSWSPPPSASPVPLAARRISLVAVRLEIHRDAVDAIALMGRRRAVVEDMSQMAAAGRAMDLGRAPCRGCRRPRFRRCPRPARRSSASRCRSRTCAPFEQCLAAAGAGEFARPLFDQQGAAAGALGPVLAHDVILLGCQELAPFGVAARDRIGLVHRGPHHERGQLQLDRTRSFSLSVSEPVGLGDLELDEPAPWRNGQRRGVPCRHRRRA